MRFSRRIPGRAFGQGLRLHIGGQTLGVEVGPIRFIERRRPRLVAVADRREGRGEHHALDARAARGAQHTERAFARGHDQLVLVLGYARRKRRRHVQHVVAAGGRLRPARIACQIGGDEGQTIARFGAALPEHGAHLALAPKVAHGGPHPMARGQELKDGVAADEARTAGYQDYAHPPSHWCVRPGD
jgi:hypothetical protein